MPALGVNFSLIFPATVFFFITLLFFFCRALVVDHLIPLSPFTLTIHSFSLLLLFFLSAVSLPPPFREPCRPRMQLQSSNLVWALSIIGDEKVGYQICICLYPPLLFKHDADSSVDRKKKTFAPFGCSLPYNMSAGCTSRQFLLNMKYSCSLFFLLCIFASITLKEGGRRCLRLYFCFFF